MWLKVKVDNIKTLYQIIKYIESLENTSITIEQSKTEQIKSVEQSKTEQVETPTNSRQFNTDNRSNGKACPKCGKDLVQKELNLPDGWEPQGLIILGYPAEAGQERPRRPLEEVSLWR